MDWKQILEIASPIAIIFAAGMIAQQIRTLREETSEFRTVLREWKAVLVRLGSVEEFTRKNTSDIRGLIEAHHKTREEMISHHSVNDIGE